MDHIVQFQKKKIHTPPHGRSSEIPRGRRFLKAKILEAKYEAKMEFFVGRGVQNKKTSRGGSMDIFWNRTLKSSALCKRPCKAP